VAQRPGKPFWFGEDERRACLVFSFPGNPVSTFLNYHFYFRDWLLRSWNLDIGTPTAVLRCDLKNASGLTQFLPVRLELLNGMLHATPVPMNGSGDFLSLTRGHAFVRLEPSGAPYLQGTAVPILIYKSWFG
jgi:molybdopterin molybdotransferase